MALLLNIDTATEYASVCLTNNGVNIGFSANADQKNHGAFLQPAIQQLFKSAGLLLQNLDAISVANGPGSYTGLRVGLASAKGLSFALNKPLITINTLQVMAIAAIQSINQPFNAATYFCPLIDARRLEVFTALYDENLNAILAPSAMIVDGNSFANELQKYQIIFSGSGNQKLQNILHHPNAIFSSVQHNATHLSILAQLSFVKNEFANLAYSEPLYLKEFYSQVKP